MIQRNQILTKKPGDVFQFRGVRVSVIGVDSVESGLMVEFDIEMFEYLKGDVTMWCFNPEKTMVMAYLCAQALSESILEAA